VLSSSSNSSLLGSRSWPGGTRRCSTTHLIMKIMIDGSDADLPAAAQVHHWTMPWPTACAQVAQEGQTRAWSPQSRRGRRAIFFGACERAWGSAFRKLQKKTPNPQIRHRCKLNCKYHFSSSIQRAGLLQQSVMILSNPFRRRVVSSHGLMSVLSRTVTYCHVLSRTVTYCHGTVTPIAKTWLNCVV